MSVPSSAAHGTPQTNPYTPVAGGVSPNQTGRQAGAASGSSSSSSSQQGTRPQGRAEEHPAIDSPQPPVRHVKPDAVTFHFQLATPAKPLNNVTQVQTPQQVSPVKVVALSSVPEEPQAQTMPGDNSSPPPLIAVEAGHQTNVSPQKEPEGKAAARSPAQEATHQTTRSPLQEEDAVIEIETRSVTERKSRAADLQVPRAEVVLDLERDRFVSHFDVDHQEAAHRTFDQGLALYWQLMQQDNGMSPATVRPTRALEMLSLYVDKIGKREFQADPQRALDTIAFYLERGTTPEQLRQWVDQGDSHEFMQVGLPIAHAYSHGFMAMGILGVLMARYALSYSGDPQHNAQETFAVNLSIIAAGGTYAQRANALTGWGPKYLQMFVYDAQNNRVALNDHWKGYLATCVMFWGFVITHPTSSYIADGDAEVVSKGKLFGAMCDTVMAMVTLPILQRLMAHKDHALLNATPDKREKVESLIAHLEATQGWGGALCSRFKEWCTGWGRNLGWPSGEAMAQLILHGIGSLFTTFPYLVAACMTPKSEAAKRWTLMGDLWVGPAWGPGHRFAKDVVAWWKSRQPAAAQTPAPGQARPPVAMRPLHPVAGGVTQAPVAGGKSRSVRDIDPRPPLDLTASLFMASLASHDDATRASASSSTTTRTPAATTTTSSSSSSSTTTTTATTTNSPAPHRPSVERKDSQGASAPDFPALNRQETHDE